MMFLVSFVLGETTHHLFLSVVDKQMWVLFVVLIMFLLVNLWLSKNKLFSNKYVYLCCPLGYLETNEYIMLPECGLEGYGEVLSECTVA